MIKFRAQHPDGETVGFGLSHANLIRLLVGEPILIDMESLGYESGDGPRRVMIFAGTTEDDMTKQLVEAGGVDADTTIRGEDDAPGRN